MRYRIAGIPADYLMLDMVLVEDDAGRPYLLERSALNLTPVEPGEFAVLNGLFEPALDRRWKREQDLYQVTVRTSYDQTATIPARSQRRVLVADNDRTCRLVMAEVLEDAGLIVIPCPVDSATASAVREQTPDAVVLDVGPLSDTLGLHVLDRIKTDPATRAIPVIICSTDAAFVDEYAELFQRHRCQTILKPFDISSLLAAVEAVVPPDERPQHASAALPY